MTDWITANKELRKLWKSSKDGDKFTKAAMKKYGWTERQCHQNTAYIFRENNLMPPSIEDKRISRRYKANE